ncbi:MAG: YtxH domain-containing protein [Ferruginibacter sp.]
MNNTGKIVTALAAGAAAGAIMGILFAPAKGSETRKKIRDAGKKLADDVESGFKKGKEKLTRFEDRMKEKMEHAKKEAEEFA